MIKIEVHNFYLVETSFDRNFEENRLYYSISINVYMKFAQNRISFDNYLSLILDINLICKCNLSSQFPTYKCGVPIPVIDHFFFLCRFSIKY